MPDVLGTLKAPRLAAAPSAPVVGQMYYDTGANELRWWSGAAWIPAKAAAAAGADLSFDGDWVAGTYQDGDTVVKDGIVFMCVGGPTTVAPDASLWGTPGAASALPADTVVVAATRIIANKLLAGDSQPAFRFMGDGKHEWGPGGATAPDTSLFRNQAGQLRTDGSLVAGKTGSPLLPAFGVYLGGEVNYRFQVSGDGKVQWGDGAAAFDTNLYRSAAGVLKTDGVFVAGGVIQGGSASQWVNMGNVGPNGWAGLVFYSDTNLYRSAAGVLKTDGQIEVGATGIKFSNGSVQTVAAAGGVPVVRVRKSANVGLGTSGANATFDLEDRDDWGGHSTASSTERVNANGAGVYQLTAQAGFSSATGSYQAVLHVRRYNSAAVLQEVFMVNANGIGWYGNQPMGGSVVVNAAAGDFFTCVVDGGSDGAGGQASNLTFTVAKLA